MSSIDPTTTPGPEWPEGLRRHCPKHNYTFRDYCNQCVEDALAELPKEQRLAVYYVMSHEVVEEHLHPANKLTACELPDGSYCDEGEPQ